MTWWVWSSLCDSGCRNLLPLLNVWPEHDTRRNTKGSITVTFFPEEIINVCTKGHDNPSNICQDVSAKCQAGSQMSLENFMEIYPTAFRTFHFWFLMDHWTIQKSQATFWLQDLRRFERACFCVLQEIILKCLKAYFSFLLPDKTDRLAQLQHPH